MQPHAENGRPLPLITEISRPFFDAAREQKLVMQRCPRDGFFFYPRARCPHCLQADWAWQEAQPTGAIHSFSVERMGQDPGQRGRVPFTIVLVDLDDGPRMIGNMEGEPDVRVGQRVEVTFELLDGAPLTCFRQIAD